MNIVFEVDVELWNSRCSADIKVIISFETDISSIQSNLGPYLASVVVRFTKIVGDV